MWLRQNVSSLVHETSYSNYHPGAHPAVYNGDFTRQLGLKMGGIEGCPASTPLFMKRITVARVNSGDNGGWNMGFILQCGIWCEGMVYCNRMLRLGMILRVLWEPGSYSCALFRTVILGDGEKNINEEFFKFDLEHISIVGWDLKCWIILMSIEVEIFHAWMVF